MKNTLAFASLIFVLAACGQDARSATSDMQNKTAQPIAQAKDALLAVAVKARLVAADVDSATSVGVHAHDGAVVLTGAVRDAGEIGRLSDAASGVSGVRSVETRLAVNGALRPASGQIADVALATDVAARIAAQTGINALRVKTSASNGRVTLRGGVHSAAVKSLMLTTAEKTPGVKSVVDHLEVKP